MHTSKTDWERIKHEARADEPVAQDDDALYDPNDPQAVDAFWDAASVRRRGERGPQKTPTKEKITVRLSPEVLDYFRSSGAGWQSRLDQALKEYVQEHRR